MEGIIYKVLPYLESSKLLFTYTPKGKVTLIAKGALKMTSQVRVLSQYLTHISFDPSNASMYTLKNAHLLDSFDHIKTDIPVFKEVAFLCEIIDKAILEDEFHDKIFQMLILTLKSQHIKENILRTMLHMLKYLGYDMSLVADGKTIKGFHIPTSQILYVDSPLKADIEPDALIYLLKLKLTSFDVALDLETSIYHRLKQHLIKYIQYHLHIHITN